MNEQKKWRLDPSNPPSPSQVKQVNAALRALASEGKSRIEKSGVIGGIEYDSVVTEFFSTEIRSDAAAATDTISENFQWTVSATNADLINSAAQLALRQLVAQRPVIDLRRTAEEESARLRAVAEMETLRANRQAQWRAALGCGLELERSNDQMFAALTLCFDDSDGMTDYFRPHADFSPQFALAILPKGRRTESLARKAALRLPDSIKNLTWKWDAHTNCLISSGFEIPAEWRAIEPRKHYRGGAVTHGHWRVQFDCFAKKMPAHASFIASPVPVAERAEWSLNLDKNGVEIRFPSKPPGETLSSLKANGWRWTSQCACWYKRHSTEAVAFAERLCGKNAASDGAIALRAA